MHSCLIAVLFFFYKESLRALSPKPWLGDWPLCAVTLPSDLQPPTGVTQGETQWGWRVGENGDWGIYFSTSVPAGSLGLARPSIEGHGSCRWPLLPAATATLVPVPAAALAASGLEAVRITPTLPSPSLLASEGSHTPSLIHLNPPHTPIRQFLLETPLVTPGVGHLCSVGPLTVILSLPYVHEIYSSILNFGLILPLINDAFWLIKAPSGFGSAYGLELCGLFLDSGVHFVWSPFKSCVKSQNPQATINVKH